MLRGWFKDRRGSAAVEFAALLPVMLLMYLGTYEIVQATSAYRKVTLTTRAVADLTSQYQTMSAGDISNVLGASAQIMVPFSTSSLAIVLTEVQTTAAGVGIVIWSKALNTTAMPTAKIVAVPSNITVVGGSVILSQITYRYTPMIGGQFVGPISMSDQIYMVPRKTNIITYTGL